MSKLLPCPFCGGEAAVRKDDGKFCVVCVSDDIECWCALGEQYDGCAMPNHSFYAEDTAVEKWNTRAAVSQGGPVSAAIEKCAQVAITMTQKWGDPLGNDYQQGAQDHGIRIIHQIRALKDASPSLPVSEPGVRERIYNVALAELEKKRLMPTSVTLATAIANAAAAALTSPSNGKAQP